MAFRMGDVVLLPFPLSDRLGAGTRPAVVASGADYEQVSGNIIVAMITSTAHDTRYDCRLEDWQAAKLLHPSTVRAKLATLSAGLVRYHTGRLSERDRDRVAHVLQDALGLLTD